MICITCMQPVDSLYTVYSNDHIQLTDCPFCQEIVDKYVEIDNVLLFIDLLLLKPGAYRHLVFNSLELHLAKYPKGKTLKNCQSLYDRMQVLMFNFKNWFCKFDRLNRLWLLLLSFEIYLTWVTEESKYIYYMNRNNNDGKLIMLSKNLPETFKWDSTIMRNTITSKVFTWSPSLQYLYFASYCILDVSLFHTLTRRFILKKLHWGQNFVYSKDIISYTILLSYGAKIFPILMLIWPYDTLISMSIIKWVANFYIIESLKIVTKLSYWSIIKVFITVSFVRYCLVKPVLILFVAKFNFSIIKNLICQEFMLLLQKSGTYLLL
ncbi:sterol homeostasis protein ARV1 [Saccharomyces eubayanus]|uniref:sterol homeostasis protein ARV1 n=1 Tax=Saccharomyces eubayanus TaxID=1080349 RepID=UPI0006C3AF18|nr:ARV1-like protein [Saccharomyces eubayanus]KOG97933.1 ARV1-like protein [Saccharomyces eubayanus]